MNDKIRAKEVRVVAPDGSQIGVKTIDEARWLSDQLGLDLVEVAPEARPPVCKIMDYGKYRYEQSVQQRMNRKRQTKTVIKEVKLRPKIDDHDFEVKRKRAAAFLAEGDKVKVTMMFRGREVTHPEIGLHLLERLSNEVAEVGTIEVMPKLEGRNMTMVIAPSHRPKPRPDIRSKRQDERGRRQQRETPPPADEPAEEQAEAAAAEEE